FEVQVLPTFRPDAFMAIEQVENLRSLISKLGELTSTSIDTFEDYLSSLKDRHDYFSTKGCSVSDHGLSHMYAEDFTLQEVESIFKKALNGREVTSTEATKFKSALLYHFALWNHEKGWIQQFHLGPLRNNNTRLLNSVGADAGLDSMGDFEQGIHLSRFLDRLD